MAMLERTTQPDKRTVGNIGDIWVDVITGMKYKLVAILMGSDERVWYDWHLIDNTANFTGGNTTEIMTDITTSKTYKMVVNNGKLYMAEV